MAADSVNWLIKDKLKGSVPLVALESIEICASNNRSFQINGPFTNPIILQALSRDEAQEWKKAIEEGIQHWRLDSIQDSSSVLPENEENVSEKDAVEIPSTLMMSYPSLKGQADKHSSLPDLVVFSAASEVHHEFAMIKYARAGKAIPHEKVVKLDNDNLHILWKKRGNLHNFSYRNTLGLDKVVEVRCGQQTKNFIRFPYTEVESQSFSLIFEKEQGEWGQLLSLDLICDSLKAFNKWKNAMNEIIYCKDTRLNRQKYRGIDPVVLWLKGHWSVLVSKGSKSIAADQVLTFANHCWPEGNRKLLKNHIKSVLETQCGISHAQERLVWNSFMLLFDSLNEQARLFGVYARYARSYPHLGMTPEEFRQFLMKEQKEYLCVEMCAHLIQFHDKFHMMYKQRCAGSDPDDYKRSKNFLSYHGFISYLRSEDNSVIKPEHNTVYQDMEQPLSDYFINSSHNTYLTGHQFRGLSSLEAYIRALLQGCRCLELDCWDGPDEPVITHGLTLTSKIRFRDVIQVIKEYAFERSDYPVILSLENHCNQQQQAIMADIFMTELGDMLVCNDLCSERIENKLPSPNDLKGKIILKGKIKLKKRVNIIVIDCVHHRRAERFTKAAEICKASSHSQSDFHLMKMNSAHSLHLSSSPNDPADKSIVGGTQQEEAYDVVLLEGAMDKLIIYCRAVPYKKNEVSDDCCEMYSFSESSLYDMITARSREIVSLSGKHMIRAYPKGSRVDSSNYDPQVAWNAGIQLVALNFQKPDFAMHLNQGKFRRNGGCGFLLKPKALRRRHGSRSTYHPLITESPLGEKSCYFTVEILSGQYLHIDDGCRLPIRVEVDTVGIPADCASFSTELRFERLNPQWSNTKHMFNVVMPDLCLVYFKVVVIQRNKTRLLFQNVMSLDSMRQ
ncbi:hypothetical protein QZH41_011579, partial [Actinostola sp. cb2023]